MQYTVHVNIICVTVLNIPGELGDHLTGPGAIFNKLNYAD